MNIMQLRIFLGTFVLALVPSDFFAQPVDLKQEALEAFKAENYPRAISLLKQAIAQKPEDAEVYYYLGYFTHYLCYDSIPLAGYDESKSNEVLRYLRKAVALNPNLGNAYYFIGAEYGARFMRYMQAARLEQMIQELKNGRREGGFPDWLVEYNRNMLKSCAPNAILFTGGDADTDAAWYLQYVKHFRQDVTVIPIGALKRPWYVLTIKENTDLVPALAPISWSRDQILSMHPYKWKPNKIFIPISEAVRKKYQLGEDIQWLEWLIEPNLSDNQRTYLSTDVAVMADIIRTNAWNRPIYFSFGCNPAKTKGLVNYLQVSGITQRLLPAKVGEYIPLLEVEKTEEVLLDPENFRNIENVTKKDYSRIASILRNYRVAFMKLLQYYKQSGNLNKVKEVLAAMETTLPEHVVPMTPGFWKWIEKLKRDLDIQVKD